MMRTKVVLPCACLTAFLLFGCWGNGDKGPFTDIGAGLTGMDLCSLAWGDYDNDGDLDLLLQGNWSTGGALGGAIVLYRNDGSGGFSDINAGLDSGAMWSSVAWGDCDGDGYLDLALGGETGGGPLSKVYLGNGSGAFLEAGGGLTGVSSCSLAWGDYDNDGDLDLALAGYDGSGYASKIYENGGGGSLIEASAGLTGVAGASLAWGDYDNDGDLDLALAGGSSPGPAYDCVSIVYANDGGTFTDVDAGLTGVATSCLAWGDYDNDGDLDLAVSGFDWAALTHLTTIYRNEGGAFSDVGAAVVQVIGSLAWGDYDNDGDLDLALAGIGSGSARVSKVYRNDGGAFVDIGAGLTGVLTCSLAWGDYDGDGDLDLALAGRGGSSKELLSRVYRNNTGTLNTPPAVPTGLSATPGSGQATFSWDAATDAETPQPGLTYNLRVGTAAGKDDVMPGTSTIGGANDGKRLIPAMGNVQHNTSWTLGGLAPGDYYWSVQAIDTAFAGSPWAPEETVTVP